jgi:hypothetical protein
MVLTVEAQLHALTSTPGKSFVQLYASVTLVPAKRLWQTLNGRLGGPKLDLEVAENWKIPAPTRSSFSIIQFINSLYEVIRTDQLSRTVTACIVGK